MENTINLSLPYIMPSQAQKHVTHNEALHLLDALVQLSVISRIETAPPATPDDGDRYIVGSGGSGAWSGWDNSVAYRADGGWTRLIPRPGWRSWVEDEGRLVAWNGSVWEGTTSGEAEFEALGIGTAPTPGSRLAVKSDSVLFSHDDSVSGSGDAHLFLNKADAGKEAGLFFQTSWSSHAALGCFASDDFQIKVSADGVAWKTALNLDSANGKMGIGTSIPRGKLHVASDDYLSIVVSNSNADATQKGGMVCGARYNLIDSPYVCFGSWDRGSTAGHREVYFGGGGWDLPDATHLRFYTAPAYSEANNTGLLRMIVLPNGNVGVGTAAPTARLHVEGSLSKTSGSFDIPHPDPALAETHRLRHCFVEAPTRGENLYRFEIDAVEGETVNLPLPAYWAHLNENPQVWVSPVGHFGRASGAVDENLSELRIECETAGRYNVLLIGTRADRLARDYFDPLGVEYQQTVMSGGEKPDA